MISFAGLLACALLGTRASFARLGRPGGLPYFEVTR